ncbi:DUF3299 domain-containing protein [Pedobacter sp. Leaf170]|uniref:DUF3299 domain-containing protein n=1 Tax=Pedobacter sp. Leaf170 TaxID=2876558 RepID=UPI001E5D08BA|nr:DUF3299 domain-containing protein [Pedobacter sp. Leaf170]
MKRLILVILFLAFTSKAIHAQVQVHTDMRTKYWNLIGLRYEKQVKPLEWKVFYPAELKALNNKIIELPGYIIPIKVGNKFSEFMLSIVPVESCPFCGSGDIPAMVEVKMKNPINYSSKPIKLKGKIVINDSGDKRSEFFLLDAEQL